MISRATAWRVVQRLLASLFVVWGAATLSFGILIFVPGDPVQIMLGTQSQASDALREQIRADLGLNLPLWDQYVAHLQRIATFDFGESYRLHQPVLEVIAEQVPPTVQLALSAVVIAVLLTLAVAVLARTRRARGIASLLELVAISSPTFWTGLLLLTVFSFNLGWFPVSGARGFSSVILPAITLALPIAGTLSQVVRHGLEGVERAPFVDSARARGLNYGQLLTRHTLRHASMTAVTLTAYVVGGLLGGAVIVEQLFARPGLGTLALNAINNRDLPIIMAIVVLSALVFVVVNIIIDIVYPLLDPRLRRKA